MKLLFDQNLSFKLCALLSDLFPDSKPVRDLGLDRSDDRIVWQHAKDNGFLLVSQDSDFADMAAHYGHPPKVIWLRCGDQTQSWHNETKPFLLIKADIASLHYVK